MCVMRGWLTWASLYTLIPMRAGEQYVFNKLLFCSILHIYIVYVPCACGFIYHHSTSMSNAYMALIHTKIMVEYLPGSKYFAYTRKGLFI